MSLSPTRRPACKSGLRILAGLGSRSQRGGLPTSPRRQARRAPVLALAAHAEAKVHVYVDPLIGGGVGTSVGLVGDASAGLGANMAFTVDDVENARVSDPAGSFERSDPGKTAKAVTDVISKPIENYCAHNWCE